MSYFRASGVVVLLAANLACETTKMVKMLKMVKVLKMPLVWPPGSTEDLEQILVAQFNSRGLILDILTTWIQCVKGRDGFFHSVFFLSDLRASLFSLPIIGRLVAWQDQGCRSNIGRNPE
jgi:hypothetical protein